MAAGVDGGATHEAFQSINYAGGLFNTSVGTAADGVTGLTVPVPVGDRIYFLVLGTNPGCGDGPLC